MNPLEIKKIETDDESLHAITLFLQSVFPKTDKFTFEYVRWQYAQNPVGVMQGFNAWDGDRIVSHFAAIPLEMSFYGKRLLGLACINVSTDESYRGQKLFTRLGEKTIEDAQASGFDFMIAVPNDNSSHAFLKYFGFYLVSPLAVKVGFGQNIFSDKVFNAYRLWNEETLRWRTANPANRYSCNGVGVIHSPISFFAKTISHVPQAASIASLAPKSLGLRPLNLFIGLGADTQKGLYFNLPKFIKRPPFNLVFRDFTGQIPKIEKEDVFLQLIDMDTI